MFKPLAPAAIPGSMQTALTILITTSTSESMIVVENHNSVQVSNVQIRKLDVHELLHWTTASYNYCKCILEY